MRRHPITFPSVKTLLFDLVLVGIVFGVAAYRHSLADGRRQVAEVETALQQVQEQSRTLLSDSEIELQRSRARFEAQVDSVRDIHAAHEDYLLSRIGSERARVDSLNRILDPMDVTAHALVAQLSEARAVRNELKTDLRGLDDQVAAEREQTEGLKLNAGVRESDLRGRRERLAQLTRPPSRGGATLAALVERGDADSRTLLQASRGILELGPVAVGLVAAVGLESAGAEMPIQGGAYARIPLYGPRWCGDVSVGLHRSGDSADPPGKRTQAYYATTLRFAPFRRSPLRLLAGLQHRHDANAGLFGIAWGR